jgi:hypothetical protein
MNLRALLQALSSRGSPQGPPMGGRGSPPPMPTKPVQGVSTGTGQPLMQADFGQQSPGGGGMGQGFNLMPPMGQVLPGMQTNSTIDSAMVGRDARLSNQVPPGVPFNPYPLPEGEPLDPDLIPGAGVGQAQGQFEGMPPGPPQGDPQMMYGQPEFMANQGMEADMMNRSRGQQDIYLDMLMRALGRG